MKQPEDVQLSRDEGEALIERIERNGLSAEDRRLLVKILTFYFWLLFALREAKLSLKRLKALVFGEKPKKPKPPSSGGTAGGGSPGERETATGASQAVSSAAASPTPEKKPPLPGHGRHGADVYRAAQTVTCRHAELTVGERCPACGRGTLYRVLPGVAMRLDGHALLSAVRYELEKMRCSACGQVFTASVPAAAGTDKYTAHARAVLALARYYLGLPWYRLEGFQAVVGIPVADATQWDQTEIVGDCSHPIFKCLETMAAQGDVIFQDDTPHRILTLMEENQQARPSASTRQSQAGGADGDANDGVDRASGHAPDLSLLYGAPARRGEFGGALTQAGAGPWQTVGDVRCLTEQQRTGGRPDSLSLSGAWAAQVQ